MDASVIRVVLADDHAVVRAGLRAELGDAFDVVGEADDAEGAIDVVDARRPDLVVCDLHMPRGGGLLVVERCATICPIVILTVSEAERDLLDAVAAGAAGYLLKTASTEELRAARHRGRQWRAGVLTVACRARARRVPPDGARCRGEPPH